LAFALSIFAIQPICAQTVSSPPWESYRTQYQPVMFNINNLPPGAMMGSLGRNVGTTTALVGAIDTPADDNAWLNGVNAGVAGYARSASTTKYSVGVIGAGTQNVNDTKQWGMNGAATNFSTLTGTTTGYDKFLAIGSEWNVHVNNTATGAPHGLAVGVKIAGAMQSIPLGGAYGLQISPPNVAGSLGWSCAVCVGDAPNVYGIALGAMHFSHANVGSQSISFANRSIGGVRQISTISADAAGNLRLSPAGVIHANRPLQINQMDKVATLQWFNSGAGANIKFWQTYTTESGEWNLRTLDDALEKGQTAIRLSRSGAAVSEVYLGAVTRIASYTVATLPACSARTMGSIAAVSDGVAALGWGDPVKGGAGTPYQLSCNGSAWTVTGK